MRPEDETTQELLLQDIHDSVSVAEESGDDDEAETNQENSSSPYDSEWSQAGVGYRKLTTIVAVLAILLGLVLSTYQVTQTRKYSVIYANRLVDGRPKYDVSISLGFNAGTPRNTSLGRLRAQLSRKR